MNRGSDQLVVVKLGGSYARIGDLRPCLAALAGWARPMVLVPGGGPFADAVRQAQSAMGFSDGAAHHMALLAMEQFGLALCNLDNRVVPARNRHDFHGALAAGQIPVWLPTEMALADPAIEMSWRVTSDSLAVWLAAQLPAGEVVLLKQKAAPPGQDAAALAASGLVDAALPDMLRHYPVAIRIMGPEWWQAGAAA
ncbi:dihydroneopterin aldolase [Rhodoligotrophos defluvii]|uniref:dihydroneopterin aldolase n=1 Tax=Rhodoligotrophos defluvii TaxID=2561934 RepID=UPI0010C9EA65|nr:dihydroneopterin aldolase [Rhodoligotrophos defluvii]